jgi:hypothetical protein
MKPSIASRCAICKSPFLRMRPLQAVCGPVCAHRKADVLAAKKKHSDAKADRADTAARKLAIKPRAKWLAEAQAAFNAFVRQRDAHLPCISCGRFHKGAYDAGHYRSVGSMPALRFNEDNCHRQCVPCNQHKAGNVVEYRIGLVARIGADRVAVLEGPHEPVKYTIEEIMALKLSYKARLKAMLADQEHAQ